MDDAENGFIQIGIGIHNERVFPAHLADHFFQVSLSGMSDAGELPDSGADLTRAGKSDEIDVRMNDQVRTNRFPGTADQISHAWR
jgi:hypothetical protein